MLHCFRFVSDVLVPPHFIVVFLLCIKGGNIYCKMWTFFINIGVVSGQNTFRIYLLTDNLIYCTISTDPYIEIEYNTCMNKFIPRVRNSYLYCSKETLEVICNADSIWN